LSDSQTKRTTLARDLSDFLIEFSIGVHRYAMYPMGHPSLAPVVENITLTLADLMAERGTLSIGVAQRQLVIEGVATDAKHPVLADLARRLHDHQLGAVSFDRGVSTAEVAAMLLALASETERGGTPIGLMPNEQFPRWDHARLHRVGYDQLEIKGDAGDAAAQADRSSALWLGLAQSALATDRPLEEVPDASAVARSIETHQKEAAYDQVIVGYLLQLAEELKKQDGGESEKVRRRVSRLISELDDGTLSRLVDFSGNRLHQQRFMLDASQTLAVDAVVKLLTAAASSSEQSISNSMTRMLTKLATHAEQGSSTLRSRADAALRENVEALLADWVLRDPNPDAYTNVLDAMAKAAPVFELPATEEGSVSGAERLVEMAIEVDAWGPIVEQAVTDLVVAGNTGSLVKMIREADRSNAVAERVRVRLTTPAEFQKILAEGNVDTEALQDLVNEMGATAVEPLLDVLVESESRAVRRRVFDALAGMGSHALQRTLVRLVKDDRWFVQRNMLALLQRFEQLPESFDVQPYLEHADPRVRREALPLAFRQPRLRDRVLRLALSDKDERVVQLALAELTQEVPETLVPTLVNRVVLAEDRSPEIRAVAVQKLSGSRAPLVLNALLHVAGAGRSLFGGVKLAPSTPAALAAVRVLAACWGEKQEARELLERAIKSKDEDVRQAVMAGASDRLRMQRGKA
jgi:hypothetical protein